MVRFPVLWRRRLEFQHRLKVGDLLSRYKDPETGRFYVGWSRWDPFLIPSIVNRLGDLDE